LATSAGVLALAGLGACSWVSGLVGSGPATSPTVERIDALMTWVERVHVEAELSKQKVQSTTDLMAALTSANPKGDPSAAFGEYQRAIQESEQQAERLHGTVRELQSAATPVFDHWNQDLLEISNLQLRRRSQARYDMTWQRYQSLIAHAKSAAAGYDSFNQQARDLAYFLRHDFNSGALTEIKDDARAIADLSLELDTRFNRCLETARDYIANSATATTMDPAAPSGAAPLEPSMQTPPNPNPNPNPTTTPRSTGTRR
jgi:hypothetical protein